MSLLKAVLYTRLFFATYLAYTVLLLLLLVSLIAHRFGLLSAQFVAKLVIAAVPILACALLIDTTGFRTHMAVPGSVET